jgi:CubicO group peptidase (beta-lactamase class C family)
MKFTVTLLFMFLVKAAICAQAPVAAIENGLTKNEFVVPDSAIKKFNVYDRMHTHHVHGLSIAVVNEGKIVLLKAYGIKDAQDPADSVTTATLFQLGSIGKLLTALAALHLVRERRIGLDQDVNSVLTGWKVPENQYTAAKKVTLRTLLSHSAGFTDEYGYEGYFPNTALPTTLQILNAEKPANNRKKMVPQAVPGSREKYSGGGYVIVQELIEELTQMPFGTYVDSVIFRKLEMTHSTYDYYPDSHQGKPIARGHDENGWPDRKRKYNLYPEMAAAGPWTTPEDVAKLIVEIQREADGVSDLILDQPLAKAMLTPQINAMGLGPHLAGWQKPLAFWHAGNTAGYVALVYGLIGKSQGAVVMTNSDRGEWLSLEMMRSIANAYVWPVLQNKTLKPLTDEDCMRYIGTYQSSGDVQLIIEKTNETGLTLRSSTQFFKLLPLVDGQFTIAGSEDHFRLVFEQNDRLEITGCRIEQNGGNNNLVLTREHKSLIINNKSSLAPPKATLGLH